MRHRIVRMCGAALAAALLAATACSTKDPRTAASDAVDAFAEAWAAGDVDRAAGLTDDPAGARKTFATARDVLASPDNVTVKPSGGVSCPDDEQQGCTQRLEVAQDVQGLGRWTYATEVTVRPAAEGEGAWRVAWDPTVYHPALTPDTVLKRTRELLSRASILDRNGDPITEDREVARIGVDPAKVDPDTTYTELEKLVGIDPDELRKEVEAAPEGTRYVRAITLRDESYQAIWTLFDLIPGVVVRKGETSLAPTPSYARAVLGAVLPSTPETLKNAGPLAIVSDEVGSAGLQEKYQRQLAGRPGGSIQVVDRETGDVIEEIHRVEPRPGEPLQTTLDPLLQEAAESAVFAQEKPIALVAVRSSTGEILAVANGPGTTTYNRAFVGTYPPGSTFKVVSAAALLSSGLQVTDPVDCPKTTTVGGKSFKNAYDGSLPRGPFATAFAHSCNTAFVGLADTLHNAALPEMAKRFGLDEKWDLGLPAYNGSVPEPADLTDRAATMIGQGRVLTSPLAMAMVAAAVESGQPRTPVLLPDLKPGREAGQPLPPTLREDLANLMNATVESGSADMLKQPGQEIYAKTGTAEYGTEDPPRTHAWMIGYREGVAFAIVIDDGGAGGKDAGPVAAQFLQETRFTSYD